MNRKEWLECENKEIKWHWYHECEKIRKTLEYNADSNATHKHHLFNTPEQIAYNNEHYEMWGFNEDGTFEYGKYIIFVTPEEHSKIHGKSEITRKKISEANKGRLVGEKSPCYGKQLSEETKKLISEHRKGKCSGKEHWLYGKHVSDEIKQRISKTHKENMTEERRRIISETTKAAMATDEVKIKMSESHKGIYPSDETRAKMSVSQKASWNDERRKAFSENHSGEKSCWYGRHHSDESRSKMSESHKQLWDDERKSSYTGSGNPFYGKHHTEETLAKIKKTKQEKRAMFESVQSMISDLTWKLFLSYYSEYKREFNRTPFLEEIYNYILLKTSSV